MPGVNPAKRIQQLLLVLSMFLGSIAMWAGAPVLWLWLAGRSSKVSSTAMGSLLMVLIGIPVTMVLIGKLLTRLDARYAQDFGSGRQPGRHSAARWLHSMRGGDITEAPSMLDKVMVVSVGLALLAVGTFYVFFSEGSAFRG